MEWISIKEKQPDVFETVLFFKKSHLDIYSYFVGRFEDEDKDFIIGMTSDIYEDIDDTTYWMPLPPPPKE